MCSYVCMWVCVWRRGRGQSGMYVGFGYQGEYLWKWMQRLTVNVAVLQYVHLCMMPY